MISQISPEGRELLQSLESEILFYFEKHKYLGSSYRSKTEIMTNRGFFNFVNEDMISTLKGLRIPEYWLYTSHSFRIGFITRLLRTSTPMGRVKQIVGHQSTSTTKLYDRFSFDQAEIRKLLNQ